MPPTTILHGTPSTMGDDEQLTTTRLLQHAARSMRDQTIIHRSAEGDWHESTYADLWERVRRMAGALDALGIGPGDHVGLLLWNDLRHLESYFSIPVLGATMIQLNLRLAPKDLVYVINHAHARTIIVDDSLLPLATLLRPQLPADTRWIVCTDTQPPQEWEPGDHIFDYESLIRESSPLGDVPEVHERTASGACYTTGTTGNPKGVLYSHRSTWLHSFSLIAGLGMTMRDTVMCLTPMFHAQCWGLPYAAVAAGARIVLPGRFALTDTAMIANAFLEWGVTIAPAAPAILIPMIRYLESLPEPPRMDRVRLLCGATEPPVSMMQAFDRLTGAEVIHAYGATETSPIVSLNRLKPTLEATVAEDRRWDLKRYQGLVMVGVDLKIVDPLGRELPPGDENVGELCVRGPWVTTAYADNPEATQAGFDQDGYWRSGDIGFLSHEGYLKVTDRLKDVIKSGGEWISSIDLENAIMAVPGVQDAAVVGVPHPKWQERPVALVVPKEGHTITDDTIREALAERFATWQLPDRVVLVTEIDRTSVGKINKRQLRETHATTYTGESG